MTTIINGSSPSITFSDGSAQTSATQPFQNRIINGAMVVSQRNGTSTVNPANADVTLDRWGSNMFPNASKYTVAQSTTAPTGFNNSLLVTSSSAYSGGATDIYTQFQWIEGFNTADLGWGTANAKTVTLSFWVRSSLTGTFGGALQNSDGTRNYPYSYTISVANTFEYKSVTIAGDTSGTWLTTNGRGIGIYFGLGVGSTYSGTAGAWSGSNFYSATGATSVVATNGATWFITGCQLGVGSTATSFDYRPNGTEFNLCMRYYYKLLINEFGAINGFCDTSTNGIFFYQFPVPMRSSPTLETTGSASNYGIRQPSTGLVSCNVVPAIIGTASVGVARIQGYTAGSLTTNSGAGLTSDGASTFLAFSAEL